VICPMIDAINDRTMEFSRQGGLAVGGFTWSLHFTWRSLPERERKRRKTEADPARLAHSVLWPKIGFCIEMLVCFASGYNVCILYFNNCNRSY